VAERPASTIIKGTTEAHKMLLPPRITGNEYCSDCGSWSGVLCARNPHNIIPRPELMPGCRYFIVPQKEDNRGPDNELFILHQPPTVGQEAKY
jgi:hypothetical protein